MPTILDYYNYAKLTTASYVDMDAFSNFSGADFAIQSNAQERLPESIANQMFDETSSQANGDSVWSIPQGGYYGNDDTGFAATLFEKDGQKVLAIRGTEGGGGAADLYQDLLIGDLAQIGFIGFALSQTVSMINYIQRLRAPAGSDVVQLEWKYSLLEPELVNSIPLPTIPGYLFLEPSLSTGTGLGLISDTEEIIVTGHSLGGHLAAMAARLFPENVSEAYTYNAPGFDPEYSDELLGSIVTVLTKLPFLGALAVLGTEEMKLTDEFVNLVDPWLPATPATSFDNVTLHNLESEAIAPGDDISIVSSFLTNEQVLGNKQLITTEPNSHVIEPFTDSLALHSLLYSIDNTITLTDINQLYLASANTEVTSEERLTEALYKLFVGTSTSIDTSDAIGPFDNRFFVGKGELSAREDFYTAVIEIEDAIQGAIGVFAPMQITNLISVDTTTLISNAQTSIAYRYALQELNPFVIEGNTSIETDQFYVPHNNNFILDVENFSDEYLTDRADFLALKIELGIADKTSKIGGDNITYSDSLLNETININKPAGAGQLPHKRIMFSSSQANETVLTQGGNQEDRLYGFIGKDIINGGDRADYIEGNANEDTLSGDAGNDTIVGGDGADTLNGGEDNDTLYGDSNDPDNTTFTGNDTLNGEAGNDILVGGAGYDQIVAMYNWWQRVSVSAGSMYRKIKYHLTPLISR